MGNIGKVIGDPAMLEQTAEELCEAAKACLKYARYIRDENYTHKSREDIVSNFHEELADVGNCIQELMDINLIDMNRIYDWIECKSKRSIARGISNYMICNVLAKDSERNKEINERLAKFEMNN